MANLTLDRSTPHRASLLRQFPVKAGAKLFKGAIVAIDATGLAQRGSATAALRTVGRCEAQIDNTAGADGALTVSAALGTFRYANSTAADLIALKDVGASCYVVDDQTVALTSNGGARPIAGTIFDVDATGVWVRFS